MCWKVLLVAFATLAVAYAQAQSTAAVKTTTTTTITPPSSTSPSSTAAPTTVKSPTTKKKPVTLQTMKANQGIFKASQGYGTQQCTKCGNNIYGKKNSDVSTCFLAYGGLANTSKVDDTVFECACTPEYNGVGSDGLNCIDLDECKSGLDWCDNNARCTNTNGSFTCQCEKGWKTDDEGKTCTDVDECSVMQPNPCGVNATNNVAFYDKCTNSTPPTYYECDCKSGFKLSTANLTYLAKDTGREDDYEMSGQTCIDINECTETNHSCPLVNGNCTNTIGSHYCVCDQGYKFNADGSKCIDINECNGTNDCGDNTQCVNNNGSYTCECVSSGYEYVAGSKLSCKDVDECTAKTYDCSKPNRGKCLNNNGSYTCGCNSGFTLKGGICADNNECDNGSHDCDEHASCKNVPGTFNCTCNEGWSGAGHKGQCEDIDECLDPKSTGCSENAECVDTEGSYNCVCVVGFTGNGTSCTVLGGSLQELKQNRTKVSEHATRVLIYQTEVERQKLDYENKILQRLCAQKRLKEQREAGRSKREVISFELPEYKNSLDAETNLIALEGYVTALKLQNHKIKLECDVDLDYDPTK